MNRGTIVVGGALAAKPGEVGHSWVFLRYLLGFQRLGWRVVFLDLVDDLSPDSAEVAYAVSVLHEFGLDDSYAILERGSRETIGLPRKRLLPLLRTSAMLLNVMGYVDDPEVMAAAPLRVFLDIDPGFPQMWRELGLHDAFAGYDRFVTIAENIGQPGCGVPTCGRDWITTGQPVVLDRWPRCEGGRGFTSIAAWRGAFEPIEFAGRRYGLRVHEFRRFAELPRQVAARWEIALRIDPSETSDLALLRAGGWSVVDPSIVAGDPTAYRDYIAGSQAEFMVAKNMYVQTRGGWFSDRSACYLASGKPVLAQDTGFGENYPTGEGLLSFSTPAEAQDGAREILGDYPRHARAAREIASAHFDSDQVLDRLLDQLALS